MKNNYNNNPENEDFLFGKDKKLPFIVPDGYFDSFALIMMQKIAILEELREFPALSDLDKINSYIVPENYFNSSKNQLEIKCELSDLSVLSSLPKKSLPPAGMLSVEKILAEQGSENELSSLKVLSSIRKENTFEVSADYFETSSGKIEAAVHASGKPAKVVSMFVRPKMLLAYAAAIAAVVCAVFYFNGDKPGMVTGDCHTLACLEKNEILNDRTINEFNEEDLYEMVDADQLDQQLSGSDSLKVENKK
ncbi:MAG: hypothetical protein ACJ77K_17515 [Bacteroidia bacterium]